MNVASEAPIALVAVLGVSSDPKGWGALGVKRAEGFAHDDPESEDLRDRREGPQQCIDVGIHGAPILTWVRSWHWMLVVSGPFMLSSHFI